MHLSNLVLDDIENRGKDEKLHADGKHGMVTISWFGDVKNLSLGLVFSVLFSTCLSDNVTSLQERDHQSRYGGHGVKLFFLHAPAGCARDRRANRANRSDDIEMIVNIM